MTHEDRILELGIAKLQERYDALEVRYFDEVGARQTAQAERYRGSLVIGWLAIVIGALAGAVIALAWRVW